jgi:hypothetical protein
MFAEPAAAPRLFKYWEVNGLSNLNLFTIMEKEINIGECIYDTNKKSLWIRHKSKR